MEQFQSGFVTEVHGAVVKADLDITGERSAGCDVDDDRWRDFKAPVVSLLRDDDKALVRGAALLLVPACSGYLVYVGIAPVLEPPPEVRQAHPTPPEWVDVYGKRFRLATLENPVRREIVEALARDETEGWDLYDQAVSAGRDLYFRNCLHCHGDLLDGHGQFASGLRPRPTDFQDPTILPQLEESYLFWRITLGGAGLPREGAPWDSAMPAWHRSLGETDVWNLIVFLFDYTGQVPRIWDSGFSRRVTAMRDVVAAKRETMEGVELYKTRCAVCHGERGAGDGVAADLMYPKPRDFSLALFKYKTSSGLLPPTDEDLFRTIKEGLPGTAMSGWGIEGRARLSDAQIRCSPFELHICLLPLQLQIQFGLPQHRLQSVQVALCLFKTGFGVDGSKWRGFVISRLRAGQIRPSLPFLNLEEIGFYSTKRLSCFHFIAFIDQQFHQFAKND